MTFTERLRIRFAREPRDPADATDRGAILIIVSVGMVALLGMAAMAVDLGMAWSDDRKLNTATDAAALAGAVEILAGGTAEEAEAACQNYLLANHPEAEGTCVVDLEENTISVDATAPVEYAFAPILGIDDGTTRSFTEATLDPGGSPAAVGSGMRPFGLCMTTLETLDSWNAWDPKTGSADIGVPFEPQDGQGEDCGPASGNWGTFDFDGGSNSNADVADWIRNGYDGMVTIDLDGSGCPNGTADDGCYEGATGFRMSSWISAMNALVASREVFTLPIFDGNQGGSGANAIWHVVGIAQVRLAGYCNGKNKKNLEPDFEDPWNSCTNGDDDDWFQLEFIGSTLADGIGTDPNPDIDTGARVPGAPSLTGLG